MYTYIMRSQVQNLHFLRITVFDALHVEFGHVLKPGPQLTVDGVPVTFERRNLLLSANEPEFVDEMEAQKQRNAVV